MNSPRPPVSAALLLIVAGAINAASGQGTKGRLEIRAIDKSTGQPVAVRMHLKDPAGQPVRPAGLPFWRDHFVFDGSAVLELGPGRYTFEMERGPEYKLTSGDFLIGRGANDTKTLEIQRGADLAQEGWWSGDLHIHRPPEEIELLMRAEDLHIGPLITWWNNRNLWSGRSLPEKPLVQFDGNRFYHLLAGEDEREGGALLFFNLPRPLPIAGSSREYPSPVRFIEQAREAAAISEAGTANPQLNHAPLHLDVEKPFWWDAPVWVATGKVDSIGLANNHQQRDGMLDNEAWGKPRDKSLFPSPHGNGRWSQHIYYQLLNCGLRIPPSAGSASGVLPNPVGYNRVYVHCGPELTWDAWWENLRRGRVFVTNGPLLRPRVYGPGAPAAGALPGHVFQADAGQPVELELSLSIHYRSHEKVEYLEIIQDGKVAHEIRLDQWLAPGGKLPTVKFTQSGWMLVRAVADNPKTYRFASTGPYYVEIGYQPRISRRAAQFFLDWVNQRIARIKLEDPQQRQEVLADHEQARAFWQKKVDQANSE